MLDYEKLLVQAVAQSPDSTAKLLMNPSDGMGLGWFITSTAKKFFAALADLSLSDSPISASSIMLHRDDELGNFNAEEITEIVALWSTAKTSEKIDVQSLVRNIKTDNIKRRADEAIDSYHTSSQKEPQRIVSHLDSLGGKIAVISHSGTEYDATPSKHLEEPMMSMRGTWGANSVLDKMFSRTNTEQTGGKPAYGLAIASMPTGSGKCVTPDTIIFTDRGAIEIGKYANGVSGFSEMSFNIDSGGKVGAVSHFYDSGIKPVRKLETRFGYYVRGTLNHPVLTISNKGEYVWKTLSDVSTGDYVAISRKSVIFGNNDHSEPFDRSEKAWSTQLNISEEITELDAYIFGALVGNGSMTYENSFEITEIDPEVLEKYYTWADGKGANVHRHDKYGHRISSLNLRRWLTANGLGIGKSIDKEVPFTIMRGSERNIKAFLRGLFDTDGSALKDGSIEFCSSSRKLADQVHILLTRFGVICRLRTKKTYAHDAYILSLNGANALRFYNEIGFGVVRKQDRKNFLPEKRNTNKDIIPVHVEFPSGAKKEVVNDYWVYYTGKHMPGYEMLGRFCEMFPEMRERYGHILSDWYFWDKVEEIYDDGEEQCYDVSVPEFKSFVSNGIVSHNTTLANTLVAYSLAYSNDKVVVMSNEIVRSIYSTTVFNALKGMYAGQETDARLKEMMDDKLRIYAPSSSRTEKGINVNSFELMRKILYWEKPQLAIMDSLNGVSAPQWASRMSENKAHEMKADAFRDTCLEFNLLMYAPGNMSEEHQKILKGNKPDKLQSVMLFGSTAYQNASDWCFLGWRDYSQHYVVNIKRTKNRHGSSLGERWQMVYDPSSGIYNPAPQSRQVELN